MLTAFAAIQELLKKLFGQNGGTQKKLSKLNCPSSSTSLPMGGVRLGRGRGLGLLDGKRLRGSHTSAEGRTPFYIF